MLLVEVDMAGQTWHSLCSCNKKMHWVFTGSKPFSWLPMESFDLRHAIIPFSLLQISNHFKKMEPGEVMEIVGSDLHLTAVVKKVLSASDREVVLEENQGPGGRGFFMRIKKGGPDEIRRKQ